jgi:hypothetical protein
VRAVRDPQGRISYYSDPFRRAFYAGAISAMDLVRDAIQADSDRIFRQLLQDLREFSRRAEKAEGLKSPA